jgi:hypothetical protein
MTNMYRWREEYALPVASSVRQATLGQFPEMPEEPSRAWR